MNIELLQQLSTLSFILAFVFFLISISLYFLLDVPKLYSDISGRTARKAIDGIRQENETSGNKAYKPSSVNMNRGKLTDKISSTGSLEIKEEGFAVNVGTEKISSYMVNDYYNETTMLQHPLEQVAYNSTNAAQLGETTLLVENEINYSRSVDFNLEVEMSFTGSSEIIQ